MCVVSMVGDHYTDKWRPLGPWFPVAPLDPWPAHADPPLITPPWPTREEFDALKRDVAEMLALMKRAKEYDAANGEPDCEMDEKLKVLRAVAKLVGIDLDSALKNGDVYRVINGELVLIKDGPPPL